MGASPPNPYQGARLPEPIIGALFQTITIISSFEFSPYKGGAGLSQMLGKMGNQLSGGEQQMLSIGRALMTNPDLLILDEATEGLAPLIRKEIWSVIARIKKAGIATIIVDKDVNAHLGVCDQCLILAKGRVVYRGETRELVENPEIHVKYLGV